MRTVSVVTTCNGEGYHRYGRTMMAGFEAHVEKKVPLFVYNENFSPDIESDRITFVDLERNCPDLRVFKTRHKNDPKANGHLKHKYRLIVQWDKPRIKLRRFGQEQSFRWDAVRFSHKVFAIVHAASHCKSDVLVWMDADIVIHKAISSQLLLDCVPDDCLVSCLKRHQYSECSFIGFNLKNPETHRFLNDFRHFYTSDSLFKQREYHDSFLFDVVRRRFERAGHQTHDIANGKGFERGPGHVFEKSILGQYMEHLKGGRKERITPAAIPAEMARVG